MSERNKKTNAIILTIKESGESNRIVTYLSEETGITTALLYGGPKSKLRSLVQPFNSGILYIYEDTTKNSRKITDFDVKHSPVTFSQSLYKIWASNLAAEIILKTKCAGDYENSFTLLKALIIGLDKTEEKESQLGTIRFLWRYICLLGIQPETKECVSCQNLLINKDGDFHYIQNLNGFTCPDCSPSYKEQFAGITADKNALTYLTAINELKPAQVRAMAIPSGSAFKLKTIVYYLAEQACGTKLKTLETGMGIL